MAYEKSKDINTDKIIIYGKQGEGKTLLAINLASTRYNRLYSNVEVKRFGKVISKPIEKIRDIKYLPFSNTPGCVIFDETGINFNSKESFTDNNKQLSEFFFLTRKKNLSCIFISQRFMSIPIDVRELVDYIFESKKFYTNFGVKFEVIEQKQFGKNLFDINSYEVDHIEIMAKNRIEYNTLENSKIKKYEKTKRKKTKKIDKEKKSV